MYASYSTVAFGIMHGRLVALIQNTSPKAAQHLFCESLAALVRHIVKPQNILSSTYPPR